MEGGTGRFVRSIKRDRDRLRKGEEGGGGRAISHRVTRHGISVRVNRG